MEKLNRFRKPLIQSQKVRKPEDDEEEKIEYVQPRLNKIVPETFNLV